jgi:hypothetical protein
MNISERAAITVLLNPQILRFLDAYARTARWSRSSTAAAILEDFLARMGRTPVAPGADTHSVQGSTADAAGRLPAASAPSDKRRKSK